LSDCDGLLIRAIASTDEGSDCISRIQIASHSQKGKNTESSSNPTMSYKKVLMSIQSFTKTTELDRIKCYLFFKARGKYKYLLMSWMSRLFISDVYVYCTALEAPQMIAG
jgi:hypothetical protein